MKSKAKIIGKTPADGNTKNIEIALSLKHLSISWRTLEKPLISCQINPKLTCQKNTLFLIGQVKELYVMVVNLSTQAYVKLLPLLQQQK